MLVTVDEGICHEIIEAVREHTIPNDNEDSTLEGLSPAQTSDFYLLLVAICHQTQSLIGKVAGVEKRGWDYLRLKLLEACQDDSSILAVDEWRSFSSTRLEAIFADDALGTTLSDPERRCALIRNLGEVFAEQGWQQTYDLFSTTNGDVDLIIDSLATTRAYADPVRKKAYFFLGLIRNSSAFELSNFENVGAPVDYHEVRGHLRLGTVKLAAELHQQLLSGQPVSEDEDVAIRTGVHEAIRLIAEGLVISPMQLHYLFWNLFRNICTRSEPFCRTKCTTLPQRYSCLLYTSPSPRDRQKSRMPSSA